MPIPPIDPTSVYYVKLGRNGEWERECLETTQTIRLGYREAPHHSCISGRWDQVQQIWQERGDDPGAATRHTNQVRAFYESDEHVLWVTFFGDRLYWCFSKHEITLLPDKTKTRPVVGRWSSTDITGKILQKTQLSGALLRVQGFRGTICRVKESKYLIQKINGVVQPEIAHDPAE